MILDPSNPSSILTPNQPFTEEQIVRTCMVNPQYQIQLLVNIWVRTMGIEAKLEMLQEKLGAFQEKLEENEELLRETVPKSENDWKR